MNLHERYRKLSMYCNRPCSQKCRSNWRQ